MSSRQTLMLELNNLRQVLVKEWLKQAYFRKEKSIEFNVINEEFQELEKTLKSQLSVQEDLLSTFPDFADNEEYTPRFLSSQHLGLSEHSSAFTQLLKALSSFKYLLQQSFENERVIISKFQTLQDAGLQSGLSLKYEKEKEKLNKLTQKYNDLNLEFLNLQETLEELTYEREHERTSCESCVRLKIKVKDLEEQLKSHSSEEIQRFKEMYEELKAEHDEIAEELNARPREDLEELEMERENFMSQVSYLQETQKKLEGINADLMKKLEGESGQVIKLNGYIDEYEEEVRKKDSAIDRAQGIIKKLNSECEKLAKDLERLEAENDVLKKDNRNLNKNKVSIEKKRAEFDVMKKTEERLREELQVVRNKYTQAVEQYECQLNSLNAVLLQQTQEKNNLEIAMEELELKLNEIDSINKRRVEEFASACSRIQDLEEILRKKDEHIGKLTDDIERITTNKDQEFIHLKRQAENMIRQLNSLQSTNTKPDKVEKKAGNIHKINLDEQLNSALHRENKLKSALNDIINDEGQNLKGLLSNLNKIAAASRAETERWIMRNEELEQRLVEMSGKNAKLNGCVKDLQRMINFKNSQFDEFAKDSQANSAEMQAKIDFLTLELNSVYNTISKDILPQSHQMLSTSLSQSHEKIHNLRQEISQLQGQITSNLEDAAKLNRVISGLEDEKESISKLLYRSNASIVYIDKHLGDVTPSHISNGQENRLSIIPESESISTEITDQARNIIHKLLILKDNELRYLERMNQNEFDIMQLQNGLKEKTEKTLMLETTFEKVQEENRYLTEIAYKEKEEKIKLKTILNENSVTEEKVTALTEYINQILDDKARTEEGNYILRSELEKTQALLNSKSQLIDEIREQSTTDIRNLKTELELVMKESQLIEGPKVAELQQIIEEQYEAIKVLQERLTESSKGEFRRSPEREPNANMKVKDLEERLTAVINENSSLKAELTKADRNKSPAKYASHLEKLVSQKNEMIADLEKELNIAKDKSFDYTQTRNVNEELERMRKKKESDRKNFQKRVKEFELVLRYIEDKINCLINRSYDPKSEKMQSFIDDLTRKNPNLMSWLRILVGNLERLSRGSF